jgi:hypothetical protein
MTEYRIVEKRFYVTTETGKRKTIIEKINKKNQYSYYERFNKKTIKTTSEYYHNEVSKTQYSPTETRIEKKIEKQKEQEEYDEYDYHIGFDYESVKKNGKFGIHGKHDFHTEFRITSPIKLSEHEIKQLILDKFSDYHNILMEDAYNVHEDTNKVKEKPKLSSPIMTEKITR